jgi:hypothetical protein
MATRWLRWPVAAAMAACVVYLVVAPQHFHWDFRIYQRAAATWLGGGDPYGGSYEVEIGFVTNKLPFVYPPAGLVLFAPFALLPEAVAVCAWLALELAAVVLLIRVWQRFVPIRLDVRDLLPNGSAVEGQRGVFDGRHGLLLLFGFNAALYTALASGNVALFEALALYVAFDALLRERPGQFAALVVAAAAVKVLPVVFLGFLLVWGGPRRWRALAAAAVAVAVLAAITAAVAPAYLHAASAQLDERRWNNPTVLAMLRDLADRTGLALPTTAIYALLAAAVLAVTGWRITKTRPEARTLVPLIFVVAALVLPRFKNYSYVELLPAAFVALRACRRAERFALAALLGVVLPWSYLLVASPAWCRALEGALPVSRYVWGYTALAGAFAVWGVYLTRVLRVRD